MNENQFVFMTNYHYIILYYIILYMISLTQNNYELILKQLIILSHTNTFFLKSSKH